MSADGKVPPAATTAGRRSDRSLGADIIIANAPDPVFVSDLQGKILQANDAVSELLGFRQDEVIEQSLSRFISPDSVSARMRSSSNRCPASSAQRKPASSRRHCGRW
jgi:PAS domain S-box-containing protein